MFDAFGAPPGACEAFWRHLAGRKIPASAAHKFLVRGALDDFEHFEALAVLLAPPPGADAAELNRMYC